MTAPAVTNSRFWEDEGRRVAGELGGMAAVVVIGSDPIAAALVARGIAVVASETRRVVLGDLVGDLAPIYEIAGGEDAAGLTDCFREDLPLNDVARPAPNSDSLFVLPGGTPPVAVAEILAHERWPRLVAGFARAEALLLLVAPIDAPGLDSLVASTSGVVVVDTPRAKVSHFPVLATVRAPAPARRAPRHLIRRPALWMAVIVSASALGAWSWAAHRRASGAPSNPERARTTAVTPEIVAPPQPVAFADTIRLAEPVNPSDSTLVAPFALELMASNTLTGANSFLASSGGAFDHSAATVSPVAVGGGTSLWYKVIVGAWREQAGADALLDQLRTREVRGRVVKVPYALLLAAGVSRTEQELIVRSWQQRGIITYALLQSDGGISLFTGAFETPNQAATLAAVLRTAGVTPVLAIRTGRMF